MGIYLDNAATTAQKPKVVAETMAEILTGEYGNPSRSPRLFAGRVSSSGEGAQSGEGSI